VIAISKLLGEDWQTTESRFADEAAQRKVPVSQILDEAEHMVKIPTGGTQPSSEQKIQDYIDQSSITNPLAKWVKQAQLAGAAIDPIQAAVEGKIGRGMAKPLMDQINRMTQGVVTPVQNLVGQVGAGIHQLANLPPIATAGQRLSQLAPLGQAAQAPFQATATGLTRTAQTAGSALIWADNKAVRIAEYVATGGHTWEEWFKVNGVTDAFSLTVMPQIMRGVVDPTNAIGWEATAATSAKFLGSAMKAAELASKLSKASGATDAMANAVKAATTALVTGRRTRDSVAMITRMAQSTWESASMFVNKYHGLPPEVPLIVNRYRSNLYKYGQISIGHSLDLNQSVESLGDALLIGQVLRGEITADQLPARLVQQHKDWAAMRDWTEKLGVDTGVLKPEELRDNYMRRLYTREAYAHLRAGAFGTPKAGAPMEAREYRAGEIEAELPLTGMRSAFGRQLTPTRGLRGLRARFQMGRKFDKDEDAIKALAAITDPILQDPRIALPAHTAEMGLQASNKELYEDMIKLGPPWVVDWIPGTTLEPGYEAMSSLVGQGAMERYGWGRKFVHPRLAVVIKDITARSEVMGNQLVRTFFSGLTEAGDALKTTIFLNPLVHTANQLRAALLSEGFGFFTKKYYNSYIENIQDARIFGPKMKRYVDAGGTTSAGRTRRFYGEILDEIFAQPVIRQALASSRIKWEPFRRSWYSEAVREAGSGVVEWAEGAAKAGVLGADIQLRLAQEYQKIARSAVFIRQLSDELLWHTVDAGGRLTSFEHMLEQLAPEVKAGRMTQAVADQKAARYAELIWNNYSTADYGNLEKMLNAVFFVYPWMRGRAKLFAAIARSYLPGVNPAEVQLYRKMATRWSMMNLVIPHVWRAVTDHGVAGLEAARIPIGYRTDAGGHAIPIYIKPSGWLNDAVEMMSFPYWANRLNPAFELPDIYGLFVDAIKKRKSLSKAMPEAFQAAVRTAAPAGLGQAFYPGYPAYARILPFLGVQVEGPPPSEDPRVLMEKLINVGDWYSAGVVAQSAHFAKYPTVNDIPWEGRAQFIRGYEAAGRIRRVPLGR
jgi:hypothetical protein